MQKNLLYKTLFIIAVLLVFAGGIVGIPDKWSGEGLKRSLLNRIHLGLDLRGGTHLILQVMVNDAVNGDSDATIERLKETLSKANIHYTDISKPDPTNNPGRIEIKGIAPEQASQFSSMVADNYPSYNRGSAAGDTFVLTMKPANEKEVKDRAVAQSIETIRSRVDTLGVSEPVIEQHGLGQDQILVQLPGVDDPERVKEIMQSTAMLEIRQGIDNQPYTSEAEALKAHGGTLPLNAVLLHGNSVGSSNENAEAVYVISRSSVVAGRDIRDAEPGKKDTGAPIVNFYLTNDGGGASVPSRVPTWGTT